MRVGTLCVADDGPGIPQQRRDLFEGRKQGLGSEGMGLGLYLVDTLTRQFGGEVDVRANEPRGTVFSVRLQRLQTVKSPFRIVGQKVDMPVRAHRHVPNAADPRAEQLLLTGDFVVFAELNPQDRLLREGPVKRSFCQAGKASPV